MESRVSSCTPSKKSSVPDKHYVCFETLEETDKEKGIKGRKFIKIWETNAEKKKKHFP